jgi:N-succinyl-L-ornithine transcarbamylase
MNEGVIMNGDKAEHISEAAAVVGQYCDIVGVRSFPGLVDREEDYSEKVLNQFLKYTGKPLISLESATRHPLQSLTDLITINEYKKVQRPKVVLTWAPHVKALPQCVPNSFAEWMNHADVDFTIAHPKGYELAPEFAGDAKICYDPKEAFEGADFIYAKNWSSYQDYGKILSSDPAWMVTMDKMKLTNNAKFMHCLPVRRNVVVEDAVLDSEHSIVIQQAGNRVWAAQVVLKEMILTLMRQESPYLF